MSTWRAIKVPDLILLYLAMSELFRCPKLHKDWPRYGHYKIYFRAVAADESCIFTAVVWSIRLLCLSQQASPGTLYCLRWLFGHFYPHEWGISPRATMIYNMTAICYSMETIGGFMVVIPYFGAAKWWECELGDWFDVCCSSDAGTHVGTSKKTIRFCASWVGDFKQLSEHLNASANAPKQSIVPI